MQEAGKHYIKIATEESSAIDSAFKMATTRQKMINNLVPELAGHIYKEPILIAAVSNAVTGSAEDAYGSMILTESKERQANGKTPTVLAMAAFLAKEAGLMKDQKIPEDSFKEGKRWDIVSKDLQDEAILAKLKETHPKLFGTDGKLPEEVKDALFKAQFNDGKIDDKEYQHIETQVVPNVKPPAADVQK